MSPLTLLSPLSPLSLSDSCVIVRFGDAIDAAVNERVLGLAASLERDPLPGQRDVVPAFASLAVHFDPCFETDSGRAHSEAFMELLRERCADANVAAAVPVAASRLIEIAVCYDVSVADDLEHVAAHAGISIDELAALHTAPEYRVHMIGFTPGFPYLGGLDPRLAMPRRTTPRERVPAGSVAIGGEQTGIYPNDAPGGWWIIGRTPMRLFDASVEPPSALIAGDRIRFRAIDPVEFREALT